MTPETMKKRRIELNMTQIELAIAVGVSVPAYRLWEAGGTKPTAENLIKLKEALGGETSGEAAEQSKQE